MINEEMQSYTLEQFFDYYTKLIESNRPFTFVRWGDGEIAVLDGLKVGKQSLVYQNSEWVFEEGGRTKLGDALAESLKLQGPDNHYGLPCRCCASQSEHMRLIPIITESPVAPNTLFGNANYKRFIDWIQTLDDKFIPVSLVVNHLAEKNLDKFPFKVNRFWGAPDNCIKVFEEDGEDLIRSVRDFAKSITGNLVFVAAGPMSEVFITEMWYENPTNQYIDVGSSLDVYSKSGVLNGSRPHHDPNNHYAHVECRMTGPFNRPY